MLGFGRRVVACASLVWMSSAAWTRTLAQLQPKSDRCTLVSWARRFLLCTPKTTSASVCMEAPRDPCCTCMRLCTITLTACFSAPPDGTFPWCHAGAESAHVHVPCPSKGCCQTANWMSGLLVGSEPELTLAHSPLTNPAAWLSTPFLHLSDLLLMALLSGTLDCVLFF